MYCLSANQMGGTTTSTVDITTNSTVMLSFLHWVIPQYIVLASTSDVHTNVLNTSATGTTRRTLLYCTTMSHTNYWSFFLFGVQTIHIKISVHTFYSLNFCNYVLSVPRLPVDFVRSVPVETNHDRRSFHYRCQGLLASQSL